MTSRVGERALGLLAGSCVVVLIMLIVLLWTGVGTGMFNSEMNPKRYSNPRTEGLNSSITDGDYFSKSTTTSNFVPGQPTKTNGATSKVKQLSIAEDSDGRDVEFVKPLKIASLPLHEEDRLYGPDQWLNSGEGMEDSGDPPLRHHSGHFRHKMAEVWDPHPQYEFTAFGRRFHLTLTHDSSFVHPDLQVTHVWHNTTTREHPGLRPGGCFYTGHIIEDPHSSVVVSLCHGMTGYIQSNSGSFFIEPAEHWKDNVSPLLHAVYRTKDPKHTINHIQETDSVPHCGVMDEDILESSKHLDIDERSPQFVETRSKRSLSRYEDHRPHSRKKLNAYSIEIVVVADKKMADYHGDGLNHYILSLMHTVDKFYKHASVGNPITIAVVKIMVKRDMFDNSPTASKNQGTLAPDYLRKFCSWQSKYNNNNDHSPEHYDTALLLTRETLCRSSQQQDDTDNNGPKCDTLGLAELGTMCSRHSSCSIVKDNGLSAAFTIAHELGHVLNMPHDDDERCRPFHSADKVANVMSRMLDNNASPYSWSNCSRHFVTEFLDAGYGDCLLDIPFKDEVTDKLPRDWLPGENFTEDQQCELANGPGSKICSYMLTCSSLWCGLGPDQKGGCKTNHMPRADGTPCGDTSQWCQQGECVPRDRSVLVPVNGGWGPWQEWGPCSRTCGGGVKKAVRFCDKPRNTNGGRYCLGLKVKYMSCNIQDCPAGSKDFREVQCAEHNGNNFNIQGLPSSVTWVPKYGGLGSKDRCMLYCRVSLTGDYYALRNQVVDGTPCGPDTYDMCVNGMCKPAGCDHKLYADLKLDFCGKCGGDNSSCNWITGSYNRSIYGYNEVVRIPAGSSNIDIRQTGQDGQKDENYLALVDSETGEYILNGRYSVTNYLKMIPFGGAKIQYSGSDAGVERLNTSRPINKELILEVLIVGRLQPADISYKYTSMKQDYHWVKLESWTDCDKVCNGLRHRTLHCVQNTNHAQVDHSYCNNLEKPMVQTEACNSFCTLKWHVWLRSECSSHCGRGTRTLHVQCVQETFNDKRMTSVPSASCNHLLHLRPPDKESCVGKCETTRWLYGDWSPCSATCGQGVKTRTASCVDEEDLEVSERLCQDKESVLEEPCNRHACPQWALGVAWTPCSVTCGVGERNLAYFCEVAGRVVTPSLCQPQPKPEYKKSCTMPPCQRYPQLSTSTTTSVVRGAGDILSYGDDAGDLSNSIDTKRSTSRATWRTGPWADCSRSCGGGMQRRQVRCLGEDRQDVDDFHCVLHEKPQESVHCNQQRCPSWTSGPWGECNVSCGVGYRHRQVGCQSHLGKMIGDDACPLEDRMRDSEECRLPPCRGKSQRWKIGAWGPCSKSCGSGTRKRTVECAAHDGRCDPSSRPKVVRNCKHLPCPNSWVISEWTECSVTCGSTGFQRRSVVCNSLERYNDARTDVCNGEAKPLETQPCPKPACDSQYHWRTGEWQVCVQPPNGRRGHQIRRITCYHSSGKKVPQYKCHKESKPNRKRRCNHKKFTGEYASCSEVQQRQKTTDDRDYQLTIQGRAVTIFCHQMDTDSPREFLTLENENGNFAEIYDRRLLTPDSCPDNGIRRDNCACVLDAEGKAGLTVYRRIRLNITSLRVHTQDTTFARQVKGKKVAYAESGDCYSQSNCPQGLFSIDLKGTPFRVSSRTKWEGHGSKPSIDIRREEGDQRIYGKCGGYCGTCSPHSLHGLTLDWLQPP